MYSVTVSIHFCAAVPLFKSGAKSVRNQLFHSSVNALRDLIRGDNKADKLSLEIKKPPSDS